MLALAAPSVRARERLAETTAKPPTTTPMLSVNARRIRRDRWRRRSSRSPAMTRSR